MTLEVLVLYADRAEARIAARAEARLDDMVLAVRAGNADPKVYRRWMASRRRKTGGAGLSGESLEMAIRSLAASHPEYVVMEAA